MFGFPLDAPSPRSLDFPRKYGGVGVLASREERAMRVKSPATRILATVLLLVFPSTASPLLATVETASISGTLFSVTSSTPLAGARLNLEDARGGSYVSAPAGVDGAFDVGGLPASSYRVAVESNGALYVVNTPVKLEAGASQRVRLAVRDGGGRGRGRSGRAESGTTESGKAEENKNGTSFWSNPLTATLIVVAGAVLVGVIVDQSTSDDTPASPSLP